MAVSGTIGRAKVDVMSIMDMAFARAKIKPQQITSEMLEAARQDLDLYLKNISATGVQLWCDEPVVVPLVSRSKRLRMPNGTADVDSVAIRQQGIVLPVDIKIDATSLFPFLGGDGYTPATSDPVVIQLQEPSAGVIVDVQMSFLTSGVRIIQASFSTDGIAYGTPTLIGDQVDQYRTSFTSREQVSFVLDIPRGAVYVKIETSTPSAMDLFNLILVSGGSTRPLTSMGQDDVSRNSNPDKLGLPAQYFTMRHTDATYLMLWPVPDHASSLRNDLVVWRKRYVMDVGRLTNRLDIPDRWLDPIIWNLGWRIAQREPESQADWIAVKGVADEIENKTRPTERVQGPIKFRFKNKYGSG